MTGGQLLPVKLVGVGASPGAAVGRAFPIDRRQVQEPRRHLSGSEVEGEVARLGEALARSRGQLEDIKKSLVAQPEDHGLILEAHRMMLSDPALVQGAETFIRDDLINAEWAVRRVVKRLRAAFEAMEDPYFQERRSDVEFVGDRLVQNLMGVQADIAEAPPEDAIIVAHDLSPADALLLLNGRKVAGIVTEMGGKASHTAIVARALEVPAVLGVERIWDQVGSGDVIALDGSAGVVVIHPADVEQRAFLDVQRRYQQQEQEALATRELEARTLDGHAVRLWANIELVEEIPSVLAHGAEGIGLYRTEFLFLNRRDLPDEEEHFKVYSRLLEEMGDRPVTVRTFDLGGEKALASQPRSETNPSLGLRAIRYSLAHPEIFLPQARALWRASRKGPLRVMFPLIIGPDELRLARRLFEQAREQVLARGEEVGNIPLGIMVETPAAALVADLLARDAAFFAIGTNDLIQYTLAMDRRNPDVSYLYNPLHPALLRMIRQVVEAARAANIPVSVCGEMAGDPAYALVLLALGVRELSMSGTAIPMVKQVIRSSSMAEARKLLEQVLALRDSDEAERRVRAEMKRRFPDVCGTSELLEGTPGANGD